MLIVESLKVIAFTHKSTELDNLSQFFIEESEQATRLQHIKQAIPAIEELYYLATCNRIEFVLITSCPLDNTFLTEFFKQFNPQWTNADIDWAIHHALLLSGNPALRHFLEVASSLDSLVVGEREIIGQVRKAFELSQAHQLSGEMIKVLLQTTVKTAKEVFTHTKIAEKSVSVVFLAYQMLQNLAVTLDARILIIGAGQTNTTMAKYLLKHGFTDFTVFNRTLSNAEKLAADLQGKALPLSELAHYQGGFDVIISCTGSSDTIVTPELYNNLVAGDTRKKVLIDLAIPNDIDKTIKQHHSVHLIEINDIKEIADRNLNDREKELDAAHDIVTGNMEEFHLNIKQRQVELAMKEVPRQIREIKEQAISAVFAKEMEQLDESAKEVLEKVITYMEKKYISIPMVMAKNILIGEK